MLLRTRITLIVALGFVLLVAVLGLGSYLSDRQDEKRFSEIATLAQSALWDEIVRGATADLVDEHGRLSDVGRLPQCRAGPRPHRRHRRAGD